VSLRDVVADATYAERKPFESSRIAAFLDQFGQLMGVHIADVSIQ
jgi:hypothetical protein